MLGWLSIKDQIFVQYFKILTKIKTLRKDHSLVQETNLEEVLQHIKEKKFPTLYHPKIFAI